MVGPCRGWASYHDQAFRGFCRILRRAVLQQAVLATGERTTSNSGSASRIGILEKNNYGIRSNDAVLCGWIAPDFSKTSDAYQNVTYLRRVTFCKCSVR